MGSFLFAAIILLFGTILGMTWIYWINGRNIVMRFIIFAGPLIYLAMIGTYLVFVVFPGHYLAQMVIYVVLIILAVFALEGVGRFLMRPLIMNMMMVLKTGEELVGTSETGLRRNQNLTASGRHQIEAIVEIEETIQRLHKLSELHREHATETKNNAVNTVEISKKGIKEISMLDESVRRIEEGSNEITSITKTIDEISFQTHLLSLNASVEAARAKEAGLGFSVVADEVRSLSRKVSEAARMTTDILERNRKEVEDSRKFTSAVADLFESLNQSINHSDKLADEISAASQEQYEYVSRSVWLLDNVSERIRSNAVESQKSEEDSKDLSDKSTTLQNVAREFSRLIKGK